MRTFTADIGVDLGTATVLIYLQGRGVVLREPSVVALETESRRIVAVGEEARRMLGRTPGNITAVRPLRDGVIADYDLTETMLRHFLGRVCGRRMFFRPRVMVCIPSGVTTVERRAVVEAVVQAGAGRCFLIEEPMAAALGAGLDISQPSASMVVDIGGGTTDIAVMSLGGIVISDSIRVAGDRFDEAIVRHVKQRYNLAVGERTAEEVKIAVGTAIPDGREASMDVRGRDLVAGLPKTVTLTSTEVQEAMEDPIRAVLEAIRSILEKTPPELAADIVEKGMVLSGGGALLHGLDRRISQACGVPASLTDDPVSCVVVGAAKALENFEALADHVVVLRTPR